MDEGSNPSESTKTKNMNNKNEKSKEDSMKIIAFVVVIMWLIGIVMFLNKLL